MVFTVQEGIGAAQDFEAAAAQELANNRRVMDGLPDILFEGQLAVFENPDLQITSSFDCSTMPQI